MSGALARLAARSYSRKSDPLDEPSTAAAFLRIREVECLFVIQPSLGVSGEIGSLQTASLYGRRNTSLSNRFGQ